MNTALLGFISVFLTGFTILGVQVVVRLKKSKRKEFVPVRVCVHQSKKKFLQYSPCYKDKL